MTSRAFIKTAVSRAENAVQPQLSSPRLPRPDHRADVVEAQHLWPASSPEFRTPESQRLVEEFVARHLNVSK